MQDEKDRQTYQKLSFEYQWIMIELFDQMVRMRSGGEMQKILDEVATTQNAMFAAIIQERVGTKLIDKAQNQAKDSTRSLRSRIARISLDKITNKILYAYLKMLRWLIPQSLTDEIFISTSIGERHKWAYDRISLQILLSQCGFKHITQMHFAHSQIPHFNTFLLDINSDNTPYKGSSSLYMECQK